MGYKLKRILIYPDGVTEKQVYPVPFKPGANTLVYYQFNGNLNDSSGNGHTLTNSGTISYNTSPKSINLSLNSYLYTNPNDTFNHNWTLNAWVYYNSFGQIDNSELLTIGGKGTRKLIACGISKQGLIRLDFYSDDHGGNITLQTGQWYNLVWTYNYSTKAYNAYVNGVNGLTGTLGTQYSIDGGKNLNIGVFPSDISTTAGRIDGKLSEYIVESKEWTVDEIQNYYNLTKSNYGL